MADKPKLTRAERKQIEAVIRKYRGDGKPHTAQDTIPYALWYDALYARGFADDLWNARSAVEFLRRQRKQVQQIK